MKEKPHSYLQLHSKATQPTTLTVCNCVYHCVCVCVCVRVCVRACVHACVCVVSKGLTCIRAHSGTYHFTVDGGGNRIVMMVYSLA